MRVTPLHIGATTMLCLGLLSGTAQAAPLGSGSASTMQANADTSALVQKAAYRRCWFVDGVRHCRLVGDSYGYGYDDYYDGPAYGYGPGIGFFFGGGGRHGGGHFHGGHGGHGGFHGGGGHGGGGHHR